MELYAKDLLQVMEGVLVKGRQTNNEQLTFKSLEIIMTVADIIEANFATYYGQFMPTMIEILKSVDQSNMNNKKLRAKAIETVGSIIASVSQSEHKESFAQGVTEITTELAKTLQSKLDDDDPQDLAIKDTLTQCAGFLGPQFAQFMPMLLTTLVNDANLNIDFKMEAADLPSVDNKNLSFNVKVNAIKGMGEQRISMNTEAIQKKTSAFALLAQISSKMGVAFAPYCEALLPIVIENATFCYSSNIRKSSLKTLTHMLVAMGEPLNVQTLQSIMSKVYFEPLQKAINQKNDAAAKLSLKHFVNNLRELNKVNHANRAFFTQEQVVQLGPLIDGCLKLVTELRAAHQSELVKSKKGYELDEEDKERIEEEIAGVGKLSE
jgi:hypothetical protein